MTRCRKHGSFQLFPVLQPGGPPPVRLKHTHIFAETAPAFYGVRIFLMLVGWVGLVITISSPERNIF